MRKKKVNVESKLKYLKIINRQLNSGKITLMEFNEKIQKTRKK